MVARSMAAFLSVQVPAEDQIRLKPSSELHLTPKAQQVSDKAFKLQVSWCTSLEAGGSSSLHPPGLQHCSSSGLVPLVCSAQILN